MHTLVISITGLAMVAADPPLDCSLGDYGEGIGWDLDISGVAQCLTTDITVDDWLSCLSDQPVSVDCINGLSANIADNLSVCDTPCESINSTDCRICNGVVAIQQIVLWPWTGPSLLKPGISMTCLASQTFPRSAPFALITGQILS